MPAEGTRDPPRACSPPWPASPRHAARHSQSLGGGGPDIYRIDWAGPNRGVWTRGLRRDTGNADDVRAPKLNGTWGTARLSFLGRRYIQFRKWPRPGGRKNDERCGPMFHVENRQDSIPISAIGLRNCGEARARGHVGKQKKGPIVSAQSRGGLTPPLRKQPARPSPTAKKRPCG